MKLRQADVVAVPFSLQLGTGLLKQSFRGVRPGCRRFESSPSLGDLHPEIAGSSPSTGDVFSRPSCRGPGRGSSAIGRLGPGVGGSGPRLGFIKLMENATRLLRMRGRHPCRVPVTSLQLGPVCSDGGIERVLGRRRPLS